MENYNKVSVTNKPHTELHDALGLTGAEISINALPLPTSTKSTKQIEKQSICINEDIGKIISELY